MSDAVRRRSPLEEERLLARVLQSLAEHAAALPKPGAPRRAASREAAAAGAAARRAYDEELVSLRDEIGEARLEDVPALVAQMERLQMVSLTRADLQTMLVDRRRPTSGTCACASRSAGAAPSSATCSSGARPSSTPRAASTSSTGGTRP